MRIMPCVAMFTVLCICGVGANAGDFTVYVSNERSGDVTVLDGSTMSKRATWPVGKRPRGIHVTPDGQRLLVAVSGSPIMAPGVHADRSELPADKNADGIVVLDPTSGRILRKLDVGSDPEQFAVTPDGGRIIVSNEDEASASCWDIATGRRVFVAKVSEEPEGVAISPSGAEVYVTCEQRGEIFVLAADTGRELAKFNVRGRPRSVAFVPALQRAYVPAEGEGEVSVVDTRERRVLRTVHLEGPDVFPMMALTARDGATVYVSTGRGNTVVAIDTRTNSVRSTIKVGQRTWGIALSPDGTTLYAANGRSDDLSVVDVAGAREIRRVKVGQGPWGIAVGP